MKSVVHRTGTLEWAVARHSHEDETCSGDEYLVQPTPSGLLVAVIDGIGHGPHAADAAAAAVASIRKNAAQTLPQIVRQCHDALRRTRGIVLSMASFHDSTATLTWLGVGNVEGVLLPPPQTGKPPCGNIPLRGGVVGSRLPVLKTTGHRLAVGDLLIRATDGVQNGFADNLASAGPVSQIAERILQQFGKQNDDALVFVGRYVGRAA
jgi:phosphoserine phosphatase RsbX